MAKENVIKRQWLDIYWDITREPFKSIFFLIQPFVDVFISIIFYFKCIIFLELRNILIAILIISDRSNFTIYDQYNLSPWYEIKGQFFRHK